MLTFVYTVLLLRLAKEEERQEHDRAQRAAKTRRRQHLSGAFVRACMQSAKVRERQNISLTVGSAHDSSAGRDDSHSGALQIHALGVPRERGAMQRSEHSANYKQRNNATSEKLLERRIA